MVRALPKPNWNHAHYYKLIDQNVTVDNFKNLSENVNIMGGGGGGRVGGV